jgi:hypothetical protein
VYVIELRPDAMEKKAFAEKSASRSTSQGSGPAAL